jgi:hypothetical protein
MAEFTLLRDLCRIRGDPETLETIKEKKPVVIIGGKNAECFGFLSRTITYIQAGGTELLQFEGVDLSLESVLAQCPAWHWFFNGA